MTLTDTENNVVALPARRAGAGVDCFVEVENYWHALCRGRMMPARDDVDPRGIAGALDRVFLIERIAPGLARFRLAGQHLSELVGAEMRGLPVSALVAPGARDALADALTALFEEPARVELTLEGQRSAFRGRVTARMLMLPLRDRHGEVTRAIGCLCAGQTRIRSAQKFEIAEQSRRTLIGYAALPERPLVAPAVTAPDATTRAEGARAHLRLVSSGV